MRNKSGLTMIEIILTITIVGVLAVLALPNLQKSIERTRLAEGIVILEALRAAQLVFFEEHGRYAGIGEISGLDITIPASKDFGNYYVYDDTFHAAKINRINSSGSHVYWLKINIDGTIYCEDLNGFKNCSDWGTTQVGSDWVVE